MSSTAPSNGQVSESRELSPHEQAIMRLACDVPYFTAPHIDSWFSAGDIVAHAASRRVKRSSRRSVGGARATLRQLVERDLLAESSVAALTFEYHREPVSWRPGAAPPDPTWTAAHLRARMLQFARRTWLVSPNHHFSDIEGISHSVEVLPRGFDRRNVEKPNRITVYRATERGLFEFAKPPMSEAMLSQTLSHFKSHKPQCDCERSLSIALDQGLRVDSYSRGLALASFYLDMVAKGRRLDPTTPHAKSLPVDFERNWQGLGSLGIEETVPDALLQLPQAGGKLVAIGLSMWCEHAVEAFHRACEAYRLPYALF